MYLRYEEMAWELEADAAVEAGAVARPRFGGHEVHSGRLPVVTLNDVKLHAITEAGTIQYILDELDAGHGGVVVTPNLDHLRRCGHDMSFAALVAEADLVVADGMPLVWASKLQKTPLPERVAGSDLISSLSARAAQRGRSIFLLGGDPGTAEAAAKVLQQRYPKLHVAGTHYPPFGFDKKEEEIEKIARLIADAKPDIIYVALGSPKQELLVEQIRKVRPNAWWLGVGNSFSFLSGNVRRAPVWMQKRGLEWVHRLMQEPRRLFKRYLILGVPFAGALFTRSLIRSLPVRLNRNSQASEAALGPEKPIETAPVARTGPSARATLPRVSREISAGSLSRLRALVLLGGSVRPTAFTNCIGRAVLDLPLEQNRSLLNNWAMHAEQLARTAGLERLPIRVMVNHNAPDPVSAIQSQTQSVRVERDFAEYRGTGGVLSDLASDYNDDDLILVANAAQLLLDPLYDSALALDQSGGDVSLVSHADGTPTGLMLITCKALRLLPSRGFVDMKEQGLPLIAKIHDVTVVQRRRPTGMPIRSLREYIAALRTHHLRRSGQPVVLDSLAEQFRSAFAIVEDGAIVDPTARIHDSIILRGARVEAGAVLVRSVACQNSILRRDHSAVDRLVDGAEKGPARGASRQRKGLRVNGHIHPSQTRVSDPPEGVVR